MLHDIIKSRLTELESEWDGLLYRVGKPHKFAYYHTSEEGARFYGSNVRKYKIPDLNKIIVIDSDHVGKPKGNIVGLNYIAKLLGITEDELEEMDWASGIEEALPKLAYKYEAVVIVGDTGAETTGTPVEVVDLIGCVKPVIEETYLIPEEVAKLIAEGQDTSCLIKFYPQPGLIAYKVYDNSISIGQQLIPKSVIAGRRNSTKLPGMQYWMGGEGDCLIAMEFPNPEILSKKSISVHFWTDDYTVPVNSPAITIIGPYGCTKTGRHFHDQKLKFGDEAVITVPAIVIGKYEMDMDESTDYAHVFVNQNGDKIVWD